MAVKKGFFHYAISHNMDLYRRCFGHCEKLLQEELQEWEESWRDTAAHVEDEMTRAELELFLCDEHEERQEFQSILVNSFFAASFALFEHELVGFSERARRASNNPFSAQDLRPSSPTEQVKKYLNTLGIDFPGTSQEWNEITKFRDIRNRIMHEGGRLRDSDPLAEYAHKKDLLATGGNRVKLALSSTFYEEAVATMETFLFNLLDAYETWLNSSIYGPDQSVSTPLQ